MLQEELKGLGLTDGETKAYIALFELGSSTVGPIAKKTGISYSKIYEVLQRLMDKGLVTFIIKEKTKYFQAVEPQRLTNYLQKQEAQIEKHKQKLKTLIPQLEQLQSSHTVEEAQIFTGFKGIRTAYEELYKDAQKRDVSLFFYPYDKEFSEEVDQFYIKLGSVINKKKLTFKGIAHRGYKSSKVLKKSPLPMNTRFVEFPLPGTVDICNDKVLLTTWRKKPLGILIQSQEIADNFTEYFNNVWRQAKP